METFVVIVILLAILGGVIFYLYRSKKRGDACIGCPYAKQCGGKCGGGCQPKQDQDTNTKA